MRSGNYSDGTEQDRTYSCPHCGSETFGLVVKDGSVAYARCRLCDEVLLDD